MTEAAVVKCDQFLSHPPEEVWRALTEPELVARWWASGDIRPTVGHRFTLDMGVWGQQTCEVLTVEAGQLLSYSFAEGALDTKITWRLVPEGTGTRLFLEHEGFDLDSPMGRQAFDGMGSGWPDVLKRIDSPRCRRRRNDMSTMGSRSAAQSELLGAQQPVGPTSSRRVPWRLHMHGRTASHWVGSPDYYWPS